MNYQHSTGTQVRRGWFSFHDPWPARSLLAAGRNRAGVAAVEDYERAPLWLISPDELAGVIYGTWLRVTDRERSLLNLAGTAQLMEFDRREGGHGFPSPPWADADGPFATLISRAGGTGCEAIWALGAGRLSVEAGDLERAHEWFERAVDAGRPTTATSAH